nr:hypothetical protein L204_03400 [Cryptococcus depauperatus CBS 7855]
MESNSSQNAGSAPSGNTSKLYSEVTKWNRNITAFDRGGAELSDKLRLQPKDDAPQSFASEMADLTKLAESNKPSDWETGRNKCDKYQERIMTEFYRVKYDEKVYDDDLYGTYASTKRSDNE